MQYLILFPFMLLPFFKSSKHNLPVRVEQKVEVVKIKKEKFVERHNYHRKNVGVPEVQWSDDLAAYAQKWANRLALSCQLKHRSAKHGYGENIAKTPEGYTEYQVVDIWSSEEKYFNHKNPVVRQSDVNKYGHYSQVIWRKTKKIGAGAAVCRHGGNIIWVCNYDPPGNYIGSKVY